MDSAIRKEEKFLIPGVAGVSLYFVGQAIGFFPFLLGAGTAGYLYMEYKNAPDMPLPSHYVGDWAKFSPMAGVAALGYLYPPGDISPLAGLALGGVAGFFVAKWLWSRYTFTDII